MKSAPILLLALLSYIGQDFEGKLRKRCALGFLFGAIGDFLLSTNETGFRLGSVSFGIGHLCFIVSYFWGVWTGRVKVGGISILGMLFWYFD
jgi:uncharacterized membrane protein YhhN